MPGSVFLFSAAMTLIPLSLSLFILISLKGRRLSEVAVVETRPDEASADDKKVKLFFEYSKFEEIKISSI